MYIISGSHVKSNRADISMSANNHEEADSRISLHIDDALNEGVTTVVIRTIDTGVVVTLVEIFPDLAQHHPGIQFRVGYGTGKHIRYLRKTLVLCPFSRLLEF